MGTQATRKQSAAIRHRMESIRSDLPYDMDDARDELKQLADWKYYVGKLPLTSVTAAAVVGFLLVPGKSKDRSVSSGRRGKPSTEDQVESSFVGGLIGSMAAMALRTATTVALRQASESLFQARRSAAAPEAPRSPQPR